MQNGKQSDKQYQLIRKHRFIGLIKMLFSEKYIPCWYLDIPVTNFFTLQVMSEDKRKEYISNKKWQEADQNIDWNWYLMMKEVMGYKIKFPVNAFYCGVK